VQPAHSNAHKHESTAPFIDTEAGLADISKRIAKVERIAIDTEADSLHCYFDKLCLLQVSVPGSDWLVDPLAGIALDPLFDVLTSKEIILHGADYDLRLLRRVGFRPPGKIFDTMIAARLSGVEEFSLAALLKRHFGLEIPKASQKANWAKRPLSHSMLAYAVNDTRHLHKLAEIYEGELRNLGRMEWFEQMCERAIRATENNKEKDAESTWRIAGSGKLRGRAAAILRELWRWRDEEARAADRPAFHILHNDQLLNAAQDIDAGHLVQFQHLRGSRLRRFEEAVERGRSLPQSEWPVFVRVNRPRPTREEEDRMKVLRARRDAVAAKLKLDPSLVAPKATIEGLVLREAETLERLLPWQRQVLEV
jgi:ribonuclease D